MMDKKIVTVWDRFDKQRRQFVFNHYSEGYDETQTVPISNIPKQQKDWRNAKWRKRFSYLIERKGQAPLLEEDKND